MNNKKASRSVLYTVLIAQFSLPFMMSGISVSLPEMGKELNASGVTLGLIMMAFLGASGAFTLPFGRLSDMSSKQAVYRTGLLLSCLVALILGFVSSIEIFVVFRVIQGICSAMTVANNFAIITEFTPKERLGSNLGLAVGMVYIGTSTGPFLGGIITEYLGWRWIFRISAILLFFAYFQARKHLNEKWTKPTSQLDYLGMLLLIAILASWIIGSSMLSKSSLGIWLMVSGIILVPFFIVAEKRIKSPLLEFELFSNNTIFLKAILIQLLAYAGASGITFIFSIYLQVVKQYSPREAGMILMISPILMATLTPLCGRLSDRFNPRIIATIGSFFIFICIFTAAWIDKETTIIPLIISLSLYGVGFALFTSPNMKIIMLSVDKTRKSMASALTAQMRNGGMIISMVTITLFLSIYIGDTQISSESADAFITVTHYSLIGLSGLSLLALILSISSLKISPKPSVSSSGNRSV